MTGGLQGSTLQDHLHRLSMRKHLSLLWREPANYCSMVVEEFVLGGSGKGLRDGQYGHVHLLQLLKVMTGGQKLGFCRVARSEAKV